MDKRKFRLAVVTPVVTALVVVTVVIVLILQGAAGDKTHQGVTYSPEMAEVADPAQSEVAAPADEATEAACDFEQWVGQPVDESAVKETGRAYRILPPNAAATMDFNPERINVMIDDQGVVTAVRCG
jgi:hypothetical protein